MARDVRLDDKDGFKAFQEVLFRAIQSSDLNFLFGAGASCPGIAPAGDVEAQRSSPCSKRDVGPKAIGRPVCEAV
jgi:hypothetical protein